LRQLQQALYESKFVLAIQPIIATGNSEASGPAMEVLIRMPDEHGCHTNSADFLRSAERYQMMPQIDRWVVQATLAAINAGDIKLARLRSCGLNIFAQTLEDEGFLSFVVEALDRSGVAPSSICFEVSESAITANLQHAQRFIEVLHGIGCELALDDFGSSLGSFASLRHLPVDYLKIDGAYTRNLSTDRVNQEMVSAMIKLARTMEFRVVAEQVEEQEDFDWLRDNGVDFVQGNFIDPPAAVGSGTAGAYRARKH
jgi:EAL domain-containing protein (putative c-di-GMP-specific phosphodiesterase class I)